MPASPLRVAEAAPSTLVPPSTVPPEPPEPGAELIGLEENIPVETPRGVLNVPAAFQAMAAGEMPPEGKVVTTRPDPMVWDKKIAESAKPGGEVPGEPPVPEAPAPPVAQDVKVKLPDGTSINLGPNPTPELRAQVKAKILAKFPELGGAKSAPSSAPTYDTPLTPDEETQFQTWKQKYAPRDSGADYDLRGAFKEGLTPDPVTGHWPDTYKKPNHPTFSVESKYAKQAPEKA